MVPLLTPPSRLPTISCRYEDTGMAAGPGQQPSSSVFWPSLGSPCYHNWSF